jgi:hypothetical protein
MGTLLERNSMEGQKLLNGYQTGQQTRRQGAVMFGPGRKVINSLLHLLKMAVLLLASLVTAFPFVWMIISALKTKAEIMDVSAFLPETAQWQNFSEVLFESPMVRYIGNSLFVSVCTVAIQVVTGAMIAYAIVFMRFRGRKMLFAVIMATYMLPTAATYVPSYIILSNWNLLNTYTGLIISNAVSIFGIFLLRQAFMQVPAGLVEENEDYKEAAIREMKEETGLEFCPIKVHPAYEKPAFTSIGMTDESCSAVFGISTGSISQDYLEDTEEIEVVLADREEVKRILKEEHVAIMCSYMLMHFLHDQEPFGFLKEL